MGKGRQAVPVMNILIAPAPDQAPGINEALICWQRQSIAPARRSYSG
jgi:hypothetical protein